MSFTCLTSFKAREALRNIRTTDPKFWEELTRGQSDGEDSELPDINETLPEDVEPDTELVDQDADDSDLSIQTLITTLTGENTPDTVGGTLRSLTDAENVDLDPQVDAAESNFENLKREMLEEGGQGKRRKMANRLYTGEVFWRHNDKDDWNNDSLLPTV